MQSATHTCPRRSPWSVVAAVLVAVAAVGAFLVALFVAGVLFLGAAHFEPQAQPASSTPAATVPAPVEER